MAGNALHVVDAVSRRVALYTASLLAVAIGVVDLWWMHHQLGSVDIDAALIASGLTGLGLQFGGLLPRPPVPPLP